MLQVVKRFKDGRVKDEQTGRPLQQHNKELVCVSVPSNYVGTQCNSAQGSE